MGESNTPPVSPRGPEMEDSDEEVVQFEENEDFENGEFEEVEILEEDMVDEEEEDNEDETIKDVVDNSILTFSKHTGMVGNHIFSKSIIIDKNIVLIQALCSVVH